MNTFAKTVNYLGRVNEAIGLLQGMISDPWFMPHKQELEEQVINLKRIQVDIMEAEIIAQTVDDAPYHTAIMDAECTMMILGYDKRADENADLADKMRDEMRDQLMGGADEDSKSSA